VFLGPERKQLCLISSRVISFSYARVFSIDLSARESTGQACGGRGSSHDEQEEEQICALAPLHIHLLAFATNIPV